jgi:hypothetical protein
VRTQDFLNTIEEFLCYYSMEMDRRRLILYLLLNVFVSACVTGGILFWYDRNYRSTSLSAIQPALPSNSQSGVPAAAFDPNVDIPVEIVSIVGAGTLDAEWVIVRNAGMEPLSLAGWQLKASNRNVFTFPNLTLNSSGAVQVHTISGTNTVIDLYWGLNDPVWGSGEEAQLLDPSGNVRAVYTVP